jgi:two-component system, NtrC family, response regulator
VEDDLGLQKQLKWFFDQYEVLTATGREAAITEVRRHEPPVVLQDLGLAGDSVGVDEGFECLQDILRLAPSTKVIVVTGNGERDNAVRAVAAGAFDFYQKPVDLDVLGITVQRAFRVAELEDENRQLRGSLRASPLAGVLAASDAMVKICRQIEKVAPTSASVLLLGESGTGKEVLARALHNLSPRAHAPFVAINCGAIPETLLESELFGYEKGAFTGAARTTPGKVEFANGGTLLLDEIGDMSLSLQVKLLRFLQERTIERVGGREPIPVDVRVVCATHRDLADMIAANAFRMDLYYRVAEVSIRLPPLRDRQGDSVLIAQQLLTDAARRHAKRVIGFTPSALQAIRTYPWPGNIRELANRINSAVILAEGTHVGEADLGLPVTTDVAGAEFLNLRAARRRAEIECVRQALAVAHGNLSQAADLLGITRPTLYDLIAKYGLGPGEPELPV